MGPDNIALEILKGMQEDCLGTLTQFFNKMYNTWIIPKDRSTFVALPKIPTPNPVKILERLA